MSDIETVIQNTASTAVVAEILTRARTRRARAAEGPPPPPAAPAFDPTTHIEVTMTPPRTATFVVVGVGGTGMRLASVLPRLVRPGDQIILVDPDRVEEFNLLRQHFLPSDTGKYKAEVGAARVRSALTRNQQNVDVSAVNVPFNGRTVSEMARGSILILGCVDNPTARRAIAATALPWIDGGNELRNGQVVYTPGGWHGQIKQGLDPSGPLMPINYPAISIHAPTLLHDTPTDQPQCGIRIDTQTVSANLLSATYMANTLAAILDGLPITAPCVEFSTVPAITRSVGWVKDRLIPPPRPALRW